MKIWNGEQRFKGMRRAVFTAFIQGKLDGVPYAVIETRGGRFQVDSIGSRDVLNSRLRSRIVYQTEGVKCSDGSIIWAV